MLQTLEMQFSMFGMKPTEKIDVDMTKVTKMKDGDVYTLGKGFETILFPKWHSHFNRSEVVPATQEDIDSEENKFVFRVIHTPGHSPGGVCLHFWKSKLLIAGDTLFKGSVGRSDFMGGNAAALKVFTISFFLVLVSIFSGIHSKETVHPSRWHTRDLRTWRRDNDWIRKEE